MCCTLCGSTHNLDMLDYLSILHTHVGYVDSQSFCPARTVNICQQAYLGYVTNPMQGSNEYLRHAQSATGHKCPFSPAANYLRLAGVCEYAAVSYILIKIGNNICSRVCVWSTGVITTQANELIH